jgi:hypothetical protein
MKTKRPRRRTPLSLLLLTVFLLTAVSVRAEETLRVENASRKYALEVKVAGCGGAERSNDDNNCDGPARVQIYRKGAKTPFQVLRLGNLQLYKDTAAYSPATSEKPRGLYAEEYTFVFQDFDFDGEEDLAVCNGRDGGYGGPSYNVYLFDRRSKRFVENQRLSELTDAPYLGLFFPDPKRKRLTVHSKSGCCYHETEVYRMVRGRPVLVEKVTEEARGEGEGDDDLIVTTTTKRRVGRRWVVRTKRERVKRENRE